MMILLLTSNVSYSIDSQPNNSHTKNKNDDESSILADERAIFRWGKEKNLNKDIKLNDKNSIIWNIGLELVWSMPILYVDHNNYLIVTDWYLLPQSKFYEQIKLDLKSGIDNFAIKVYLKHKSSGIISESQKLSDQYRSEIISRFKLLKK